MKKLSKNALIIIIIAIAAVVAFIIAYFIGKNYYSNRFLPGTFINGWDCSGETIKDAKADIQDEILEYSITIKERGGASEEITGEQLGLVYTDNKEIDKILEEQDSDMWFLHMSGNNYTVETAFSYEDDTFEEIVDGLECFKNVIKPEDAYLSKGEDRFFIEPEKEGSELDKGKTFKVIEKAVKSSENSIDLDELGLYKEPAVKSDDSALNDEMNRLNLMLSASVTYDFTDRQMTVDKDEIIDFIVKADDGTFNLDSSKVYDWVNNMAYETDTFGLSHNFMTSYGVEVKLEGGGDYGWCIDKDETSNNLYQYIASGAVAVIQPEYLYTGLDRTVNDIGDTYVEVCISTQTLWCYYQGQLITTTPVITGNVNKGYSTPSGSVWAIDGKKADWKFTNYANAFSKYWLPFNGECGLHDASWQLPEYYTTPDFYIESGSHGCVNIPDEPMRLIFEYMEIGYPVVVYFSTDQVVGPAPTEELIAG